MKSERSWEWVQRIAAVLIIGAVLFGLLALALNGPEIAQGGDYSSACYRADGGDTWVCGSGGEMRIDAGGTLSVAGTASFGTITAIEFVGDVTGDLTGDVTGDVTGDLTGDILGSSGTTIHDNVVVTGTLDVSGAAINYGPNNLYPIGYTDSGFQAKWGSDVITATANVVHGLTTPVVGICTLAGELVDNEEQLCSVKINGATVSIYVYKEDGSAGDSGVSVHWYLIGLP
ncbi:MAG: hypothetical protein BWY63_01810 [Chloroflexi bacterium ADurb.Bin360]|nr:MAG: hypothetical protein BWY63_01810 [Chloroflexi bacterium ADurb.Bin360]